VDQALKATDLLLQAGGFGMVIVDLGDVPADIARRVPLTSWFRFRRAVENTPAVLVAVAQESCARTCASLVLQLRAGHTSSTAEQTFAVPPSHARILRGLNVTVEVLRSRLESPVNEKKPPRPVRAVFDSRTEWVG
jgi:recombination protein RecA